LQQDLGLLKMTTLQNFGVPLDSTGFGRAGILMPKVKNRFRVIMLQFGQPNAVAFTQQVMTVSRPNVTMAPQAVHSYNSVAYYPGKAEWETVSITVRDDQTNSVAALIGGQMQRQMNFFDQTVQASAHDFKFNMFIDTLDGGNDVILENWLYEGCFLSAINYESFDYSSSDAMTIEMTVRFDNATQGDNLMPTTPWLTSHESFGLT
jgi:hypothetical protein